MRPDGQRILRSREWKLALRGGRPYLYQLSQDPDETRNLLDPAHRQAKWVDQAKHLHRQLGLQMEAITSPERDWLRKVEL